MLERRAHCDENGILHLLTAAVEFVLGASVSRGTAVQDGRASKAEPTYQDISNHLQTDLDELDRVRPGWNRPSHVKNAMRLLKKGIDPSLVTSMYGESVVKDAQSEMALNS